MKIFRLLSILILFISCNESDNKGDTTEFPVLTNIKTVKKIKTDSLITRSSSSILYIGYLKDTIELNYELVDFPFNPPPPPPPPPENGKVQEIDTIELRKIFNTYNEKFKSNPVYPFYSGWEESRKFKSWNETNINIEVDTNTIIKQLVIDKYFRKEYYKAYPVFIKNQENDTINIGYDRFIPIIVEAKDSTNKWKPIEKMYSFMCGNGINSLILPPNNIIISSKVIYQGDYNTELRIKLGDNYSNKFKGSINYSQFQDSRY
ncbi:hypothetical protein [uncultured Christiangramia sp.]|uniref:hypothetical protein n=1 Tax=Christiangramia sp. 3-2217-3z TaxID=3417564 RepID=UPI00260633E1|nr:hypothetical protein [uncultured Christiangramia sp.]